MTHSIDKYHAPIILPEAEGNTAQRRLISFPIEADILERELTN